MAWKLFFSGVAVFFVLLTIYVHGLVTGLFFRLWWWDTPLHILAGVLAGLIGMWFFVIFGRRVSYAASLCGAILLGALVEVTEFALGFTYSPFMSYPVDTLKDMCNDAIGGFIVAYLVLQLWQRK